MTLRNKDGSIYKLVGPNPVMKTQDLWGGFQVHNMQFSTELAEDTNKVTPMESDFFVQDTFLSALDKAKEQSEIKVVESPSPPQPEQRKPVVRPDLQREELQATSDGIVRTFIHCLPATLRERKDSLYGEVYKTVQYGKPTSFEGVILELNDLSIQVWTDSDKFGVGAILYPKTNLSDGGQFRWWRVQEKTAKGGGWILLGVPSDYQPSFIS